MSSAAQAPSQKGDPRVDVPGASSTIARVLPELRRCFERLDVTGKVALSLTIDGEGDVAQAHARGPVPREVIQCIEGRVRDAHFSCPDGGRLAQLDISVQVVRQ